MGNRPCFNENGALQQNRELFGIKVGTKFSTFESLPNRCIKKRSRVEVNEFITRLCGVAAEKKHHVLGNHGIAFDLIGIDVNKFSNKHNAIEVGFHRLVTLETVDEK